MKSTVINHTPRFLAESFCDLDDEQQAQFFIEVAAIATAWEKGVGNGAWWQWDRVGGHLRDCECSTPEARSMIRTIADGMVDREISNA